jgi:hypothetical protein
MRKTFPALMACMMLAAVSAMAQTPKGTTPSHPSTDSDSFTNPIFITDPVIIISPPPGMQSPVLR